MLVTNKHTTEIKMMEKQMFNLVNTERIRVSKHPLKFNYRLCDIARMHSVEQMKTGEIYHKSPLTGNVNNRLRNNSFMFSVAGENVATSPDLLMSHQGLMQSPGHRENILGEDFDEVGIGIVQEAGGQLYITQVFVKIVRKIDTKVYIINHY